MFIAPRNVSLQKNILIDETTQLLADYDLYQGEQSEFNLSV